MSEDLKEKEIQDYQERYRFWTDKRISQLSFHNNLLLTLGFAIIGYFWAERDSVYEELLINTDASIDWIVAFFLFGIFFVTLSIVIGFVLSLSRLHDLRLTSNITLTRKRAKESDMELKDETLSLPGFVDSTRSFFCVFWDNESCHIDWQEISKKEDLQRKFTELRQRSHDLGSSTWSLLRWQTVCMLIGILIFVAVLTIK